MATTVSLRQPSTNRSRVPSYPGPIAPWWHTALLIVVLLAIAVRGMVSHPVALQSATTAARLPLYASLLISEALLLYAVWAGIRRSGTSLQQLTGGRWTSWRDVLPDLALAAAFWVAVTLFAGGWDRWGPFATSVRSVRALLPRSGMEVGAWILVSMLGGVTEEVAFRGYFQRQFEALTHRSWAAIGLQAALFGLSHGYQGIGACMKITLIGVMFGGLAMWRRSLRPGMVAHVWTDVASGVFRF